MALKMHITSYSYERKMGKPDGGSGSYKVLVDQYDFDQVYQKLKEYPINVRIGSYAWAIGGAGENMVGECIYLTHTLRRNTLIWNILTCS